MAVFISIVSIIIIICLLLIGYVSVFNNFQNYIIRINEAEANIDSTLRKRFDLLSKSIGIINAHLYPEKKEVKAPKKRKSKAKQIEDEAEVIVDETDENVEKYNTLMIIDDLRSQKLSNFELDRKLYIAIDEFHEIREQNPDLKENEAFIKIEIGLNESESEIIAFRKYYNDIITDYNKMVRHFPYNIVAKTKKYKTKTYYDGKNMEDEDNQDFKL